MHRIGARKTHNTAEMDKYRPMLILILADLRGPRQGALPASRRSAHMILSAGITGSSRGGCSGRPRKHVFGPCDKIATREDHRRMRLVVCNWAIQDLGGVRGRGVREFRGSSGDAILNSCVLSPRWGLGCYRLALFQGLAPLATDLGPLRGRWAECLWRLARRAERH